MRELLRDQNVDVLFARSGREALELLLENDVALALVDVQMPEMDGFELAELMRGAQRTRDVPIIFVTAGSRDQLRVFKGYELGAVDFLFKPIEPHVLRSKTSVFFELYRQRLELARQLQERTAALQTSQMFMAILSHDLRNPLHAILTGAELILLRSGDETAQKAASRIRSSGQRMSGMIEQLLDLARVRLGGGLEIAPQAFDLGELVRRVAGENNAAGGQAQLQIEQSGDLSGRWDPVRLGQVASNLIGNALKHGAAGAPIRLELDGTQTEQVTLRISNSGSIPESLRSCLFDPFRGRDPSKASERGLGLGLYIVQQIVRGHGGEVSLAAGDPTLTTFVVELPRNASAGVAPINDA
jgi:signal transduction histidine kinase